jgi:pilus assembly protein Flp/PilA
MREKAAVSTICAANPNREGGSALFAHAWTLLSSAAATLRRRDEGATMVEYGLMVALIAVVALLAVAAIGTNLFGLFSDVATEIGG